MNMMIQIVAFWLLWLAPLSAQGRADSPFWNARGVGSRLISQPMHTSKTSVTNRGDDGFNKLRDSRISAKAALSSRLRDIEMDVKFTEATGISVLGERGGVDADQITNVLDQTVSVTFKIVATACQTILPPVVALTKVIVGFYSILPVDATLGRLTTLVF